MFIAVAALGLWLSRDYPIGTALRMSTGYVPRLLCWMLMGLGAVVLVQGLREGPIRRAGARSSAALAQLWPVVVVTQPSWRSRWRSNSSGSCCRSCC